MSLFIIVLIFIVLIYIILTFFFSYGLGQEKRYNSEFEPNVSIVVAVRDEEQTLETCLASLANLDYPKNKLEIIIVNDNSSDGSSHIAEQYAQQYPHFQVISLQEKDKVRPGKAGAVLEGIEQSSGEIVCLTDGDCHVSPGWIRGLLSLFTLEVGMAGGFTILQNTNDKPKLFGRIQALDWIYLLSVAAGSSALGIPLSWVGNNLAFRRSVYEQVGGYRALGCSLIEDFALLRTVDQDTDWKLRFELAPETLVYSQPEFSFRHFYQQRKRWAAGVAQVKPFGKLLLLIAGLTHIVICAGYLLSGMWPWAMVSLLAVLAADFLLIATAATRIGQGCLLRCILGFELHYFFYTTVLAVFWLFDRRVVWKGKEYKINVSGNPA